MNINKLIRQIELKARILSKVGGCRQTTLPVLRNLIIEDMPTLEQSEIMLALQSLWRTGKIMLTKPDHYRFHAMPYDGSGDKWFVGCNFNIQFRSGCLLG